VLNHGQVYRVWRDNSTWHPRQRRRGRGQRAEVFVRTACAYHVCTIGSVEDTTQDGLRLRFLTLVDEQNRRELAVEVRRSFRSVHVVAVLKQAVARYGSPALLRSDHASESIAHAVRTWPPSVGVQTHCIDRGSAWQNTFGEGFNGTRRREHLNRDAPLPRHDQARRPDRGAVGQGHLGSGFTGSNT